LRAKQLKLLQCSHVLIVTNVHVGLSCLQKLQDAEQLLGEQHTLWGRLSQKHVANNDTERFYNGMMSR